MLPDRAGSALLGEHPTSSPRQPAAAYSGARVRTAFAHQRAGPRAASASVRAINPTYPLTKSQNQRPRKHPRVGMSEMTMIGIA